MALSGGTLTRETSASWPCAVASTARGPRQHRGLDCCPGTRPSPNWHLTCKAALRREPMPPNTAPRPALHDLGTREPSDLFRTLATPSHHIAAWALNQLYSHQPSDAAHQPLGSGAAVVCKSYAESGRSRSQCSNISADLPGVVRRGARHCFSVSSVTQMVRSPRRRRISVYSAQFVTRYRFFGNLWRRAALEFMRHSSVQIRGGAPDYQNYLCSCNNVEKFVVSGNPSQ